VNSSAKFIISGANTILYLLRVFNTKHIARRHKPKPAIFVNSHIIKSTLNNNLKCEGKYFNKRQEQLKPQNQQKQE